ncbi:unnamed protein product [Eruca vesicaria subsp. sativa]|uniref:Uncharacterized protein n=1 Tax=Eruca vesicaria subsp. sativa TaxID=29727 RepID=A0ABC8KHK7_ERUVS|nr:unnamed protein product [Eruca vesicaria subsp. sativa]
MEKSRRVQVRPRSFTRKEMDAADLSFLPCPCGFFYVSSLCRSTKMMDVAHDAPLPQTRMRRQSSNSALFFSFFLSVQLRYF